MSRTRDTIHQHHQAIINMLSAQRAALEEAPQAANAETLTAFLKAELLPHALGEEQHLYPAVEPLIKEHGEATATMRVDHQQIRSYVLQLDELAQALQQADESQQPALLQRFYRLTLQLEAVLELHLEKEEQVYLPLFERYLSEQEQQRVLDGMHEA
ncbi:MAG TPA: hemerythrin domain-containing protein [Ktedonobacterales bacterium]|jgi:hemerythrin-like domain-containing protein